MPPNVKYKYKSSRLTKRQGRVGEGCGEIDKAPLVVSIPKTCYGKRIF
jgi:hypothetical protein